MSPLLSFSTWADETVNGHWQAVFLACHLCLEISLTGGMEQRQSQENFAVLYMLSHLSAEPGTGFSQFR